MLLLCLYCWQHTQLPIFFFLFLYQHSLMASGCILMAISNAWTLHWLWAQSLYYGFLWRCLCIQVELEIWVNPSSTCSYCMMSRSLHISFCFVILCRIRSPQLTGKPFDCCSCTTYILQRWHDVTKFSILVFALSFSVESGHFSSLASLSIGVDEEESLEFSLAYKRTLTTIFMCLRSAGGSEAARYISSQDTLFCYVNST